MNRTGIEQWQQRPAAQKPYFTPTPQTYYASTQQEEPSRFPAMAWIAPNAVVGWAGWSAHQACVHGDGHSVVGTTILGAAAAVSAALAGWGFASKKSAGAVAGAVLAPISLILAGFGVLLWSPTWPAAWAAALLGGAVNGGVWALRITLRRWHRKMLHEAGLKHDEHSHDLEKTEIVETHKTTRKAIGYQEGVDVAYALELRQAIRDQQFHQRHPDIASPAALVSPVSPMALPGVPEALALAAGQLDPGGQMSPAEVAGLQERVYALLAEDLTLTPQVRGFFAQQAQQAARDVLAAQQPQRTATAVAPIDPTDDLEALLNAVLTPSWGAGR